MRLQSVWRSGLFAQALIGASALPRTLSVRPCILQFSGNPEAVAGDEDAVVDDRRAVGAAGDAIRAEGGDPGPPAELTRGSPFQRHGGHGFARARDLDAKLEG